MIYGHGDDLYRYKGLVRANFSSNIYQRADLSELKRHLADNLDIICNYPEPAPLSLEKALADRLGIGTDNVIVTNGATEAIYLLAQNCMRKYGAGDFYNVIRQPTFSEYADACRACGSQVAREKLTDGRQTVRWLCNPNNPTGGVVPAAELLQAADTEPDCLFIIDQSYECYTTEPMINDKEAACRHNVILLHSMTKRFCIPGLRLGYATACSRTISELKSLRHPWSVNAPAIEAGLFLLDRNTGIIPDLGEYLAEAQRLYHALASIDGIDVCPTLTNFMLASINGHTAAELKDFLITRHGLLIRDASNFSGLTPSHFRVAAQGKTADDMLVEAIKDFCRLH